MPKILSVATAALRADQLLDRAFLRFPRVDYIELQGLVGADTLDYSAYNHHDIGKYLRRLETFARSDLYLAVLSWWKSRSYQTMFAWSERAGIPIAGLRRQQGWRTRFVTMFQCWSHRQELAINRLGLLSAMDEIVVHCSSMKDNLVRQGAPVNKVHLIHYGIDQRFFSPLVNVKPEKDLIVSVGEPRSRHYASLFRAVKGLPVTLKLPAYGHWYAREKNNRVPEPPPPNVERIQHLNQVELRELYARSQFVVLPIRDLVYSAGATVTLEANCMARPVIAFRSRGITDYIIDGETGILVEPGNVDAMRAAICSLLANPAEARRLGQNARQRVEQELNFETYVGSIGRLLASP